MKLLIVLACLISVSSCAKILGIIPMASFSHQIPFRPIWRELSLRGHQVTLLTTDPVKDPKLKNLTEIDLSFTYDIFKRYNFPEFAANESKSFMQIGKELGEMLAEGFDAQLSSPEVQKLIHSEDVQFDLLIVEAQLPIMLGFGWKFQCPIIGVASLDASMNYHDTIGNPSHPIVNPDPNLPIGDPDNLSFKDRVTSFIYTNLYRYHVFNKYYPKENLRLRKFFGDDAPDLVEIQKNVSMLMVSTNPIFHSVRPVNPNTIFIGNGLHLTPPKPLPKVRIKK